MGSERLLALESLLDAITRLAARGFRQSLRARDGALRVIETGDLIEPEKLQIVEIVRFEGETDPAEELVLFALTGPGGEPLGTYTALYGPGTSPKTPR